MLNAAYFKGTENEKYDYEKMVYDIFSKYNNFSVFVKRAKNKKFERAGRIHTLDESRRIDEEVKGLMDKFNIYYGSYYHGTIGWAIKNCVYTYNRLNFPTYNLDELYTLNNYEEEMEP